MSQFLNVSLALATAVSLSMAGEGSSWSYDGETGPDHWGDLEHSKVCETGVNQTPINLKNFIDGDLEEIKFNYEAKAKNFINNGHTVQVNFETGNSFTVEGKTFNLIQYHFHTPSENHILDKSFPMEVHLVHADADGNLGVVGVMFEEGDENETLAKILEVVPEHSGDKNDITTVVLPSDLLPENQDYYRFNGSLTTPPCSENVHWFVMKNSVSLSADQLKVMEKVMHAPNNRPIQPTYARPILD